MGLDLGFGIRIMLSTGQYTYTSIHIQAYTVYKHRIMLSTGQ